MQRLALNRIHQVGWILRVPSELIFVLERGERGSWAIGIRTQKLLKINTERLQLS